MFLFVYFSLSSCISGHFIGLILFFFVFQYFAFAFLVPIGPQMFKSAVVQTPLHQFARYQTPLFGVNRTRKRTQCFRTIFVRHHKHIRHDTNAYTQTNTHGLAPYIAPSAALHQIALHFFLRLANQILPNTSHLHTHTQTTTQKGGIFDTDS
jgi:hypothetical protein